MEIGPVQLMVFAFDRPQFGGAIAAELDRLAQKELVRVIDALVVHKDAEGKVKTLQITDLTPTQAEEFGAVIGALIGLGAAGEEGMEAGAQLGAEEVAERGGHVIDSDRWYVLDDIPADTAAAVLVLEHRWAIPLRDAIQGEGGMPIGDIWLSPPDLIAAGLMAAQGAGQIAGTT